MAGDDDRTGDAREAFALLGHEIRLDILLALFENWRAAHTEPRSYSELMRAVGMEDSGKFNYHLGKLRGVYVRKVADGYVPTASATALYRAVLASRPTTDAERTAFGVASSCPDCGEELVATYEQGFLSVVCRACNSLVGEFTYPFPKNGLVGRTDDEVLGAVTRRVRHHVALARTGQCPFCAGTTTIDILLDDLEKADDTHDVEITCDTCTFVVELRVLFAVELDPRVTTALTLLGIPIDATQNWDLPDPTIRVRSQDPISIALELASDDRTATIVIDGDLSVQSVTVDDESLGQREP